MSKVTFREKDGALKALVEFETFLEGIDFVHKVATLAEEHQHHPDIDIRYTKITLTLTTHDAGGVVTEKDRQMAKAIEAI